MTPATALARVLVDELARGGVTDAVVAPGSRSAPLAMALAADERIRCGVMIDERSAAFYGLGLAKATRRPAVLVSTSGTAAVNFHPGVVEASHSRVPLVVLTADRPPEQRDTGANQTVDQLALYGSAVRWFCEVGVPEERPGVVGYWRSVAARALAEATGSPPGPVHANVAFREPLVPQDGDGFSEPLDGRPDGRPWTRVSSGPRQATAETLDRLADQAQRTERGLLVAGDGDGDPHAIVLLAERLGWPLIAEPTSNARFGEHVVSTAHALASADDFAATHRPDLVLQVGKPGLSRAVGRLVGPDVTHVLIDADGEWLDPHRSLGEVVIADPADLAAQLSATRPAGATTGWLTSWREADRRARRVIDEALDAQETPSEPRTARDLAEALPDGALLVGASSMPVRDLDAFMRPRTGLRLLGNRGASGIDGFVSTALGAAAAHDGPTAALAGDLSLLHDQNGLLLADRPDLVLVVVHNDGGGIFSLLPQASFPDHFEAVFGTPHGVDMARLAATYGCGHTHLERPVDLPAALEHAYAAGGVQLIEVRTDRTANAVLHQRLVDAVAEDLAR